MPADSTMAVAMTSSGAMKALILGKFRKICRHDLNQVIRLAVTWSALQIATGSAHALSPDDMTLISQGAERGNDAAQVLLAVAYLNGEEPALGKDPGKAALWFERAALQGNRYAQEKLGDLYEAGIGVKKNLVLAFDWRLKAAEQGSLQAQIKVSAMLQSGEGTPRDEEKAHAWLEHAATEGSAEAQYLLGKTMHGHPDAVKHRAEARTWLEKAARQGYDKAAHLLSLIESIGYAAEEDWHHRMPELTQLAHDGDAEAQYQLAQRYEHGLAGVHKDMTEALHWYRESARNGHPKAPQAIDHLEQAGTARTTEAIPVPTSRNDGAMPIH